MICISARTILAGLAACTIVLAQAQTPDTLASTQGLSIPAVTANVGVPAGAPSFSLEEAYQYAANHQPAVRLVQADLAEADGQIKETLAAGIPKLNGEVTYQHFLEIPQQLLPNFIGPAVYDVLTDEGVQGSTGPVVAPTGGGGFIPLQFGQKNDLRAGLSANGLIFDATFFIAVKGARLYRSLALRTVEQTIYQTRVQVAKAYLAVLISERNLGTVQRNLDNLDQALLETRALYREGFAEKLSVDRLELTRGNLAAQQQSIEQVIAISRNLLKFQMGYEVSEAIALSTTLDAALGEARITDLLSDQDFSPRLRPEYATLEAADSLNSLDLRRIKAGYYPSLVGFGSFSRQLQRNDLFDSEQAGWLPASVVGVTLNVPIFDGFTKRAQRQRTLARQDRTSVQITQFEQQSRLALANSRASVRNARLAVSLREKSIALAEEIYRVAQIKFREGVGSSLEVNQAQSDLYTAQDALTQSLYDLAVAFTDYRDSLGAL